MLTRLAGRSFKGLRQFDIAPKRINLLIGANGTGKSNFADLVALIGNLCARGLVDTLEEFGGLERVRTRQESAGAPYKLRIEFQLGEDRSRGIGSATYRFDLAQSKELHIQAETLDAVVYKRKPGKAAKPELSNFDDKQPIALKFQRKGSAISEWSDALGPKVTEFDNPQELLLTAYSRLGEVRTLGDYLNSWRVYNIDAVIAKRFAGSDAELDRYGSNIVPFVARMLRDKSVSDRLLEDLQAAVPFVGNIEPDRILSYETLRFAEQDSKAEFQLPEMSDGTIRLLGLLAVLHQPMPPAVLVIEEPENALHRQAIQHLLGVARGAAMRAQLASQIFFTSHAAVVADEVLSIEAMRETNGQTACFVTQRKPDQPNIVPASTSVMQAIADNLGRPSDFQREGSFGDEPYPVAMRFDASLEIPA